MGLANQPANHGVNKAVHPQLRPNNTKITTKTGNILPENGCTPIFHLMKRINRTKYTE